MSAYTRREFTKLALSGVAALSTTKALHAAEVPGRPNSKVAGVQIGLNVPYSFANPLMSGDDIIKNCVALGVSGLELRTQPVEAFLGRPEFDSTNTKTQNAEALAAWRATPPG